MHDNYSPPPPTHQPGTSNEFDTFGRAWTLLKPDLATWAVAYAFYAFVMFLSNRFDNLWMEVTHPNLAVDLFLTFCGYAVSSFVVNYVMCGLYRMGINHVRRGRPELNDLFSVSDVIPAIFISALLLPIAIVFGLLFCIVPGILIAGVTLFVQPLIVDKRMGFLKALAASYTALSPDFLAAGFFVVRLVIFTLAGVLACLVGLLVTGPLGILATAVLYEEYFGEKPNLEPLAPFEPAA